MDVEKCAASGRDLPKPKKSRDQWAPRKDGWNGEKRRRFLDKLAATGVARWAAKAAGMSYSAAAGLRLRDPEFAELWKQATIQAFYSLETMLIERSLLGGAPPADSEPGDELPDPSKMDTELALKLLQMRQKAGFGNMDPTGRPKTCAGREETDAAILQRLAALRKRLGLPLDTEEW